MFTGFSRHVVAGEVSKSLYSSGEGLWPDDAYPHRFDFEKIGEGYGVVFSGDIFGEDLMEAMRISSCAAGRPYSVSDDVRNLVLKEASMVTDSAIPIGIAEEEQDGGSGGFWAGIISANPWQEVASEVEVAPI